LLYDAPPYTNIRTYLVYDADITPSSLSPTTGKHQETCTTGWLDIIALWLAPSWTMCSGPKTSPKHGKRPHQHATSHMLQWPN